MRNSDPYLEPAKPVGTVIELFAGVGGFRIGLSRSGWQTVFSNQWEPSTKIQHASLCYEHNFKSGTHTNENITTLVARHTELGGVFPKVDLIVGGFPCQDYSVAKSLNSSKGISGKKGVLWWDIHKLVESLKPKFVFLENVDRLLKSPGSQRGRDFAIMLKTLGDLGYRVEWRVINAAEAGFAQRRIRVYIVAQRVDLIKTTLADPHAFLSEGGILANSFPGTLKSETFATFALADQPSELTSSFNVAGKSSPFRQAGVFNDGIVTTCDILKLKQLQKPATLKSVLLDPSEVSSEFWINDDSLENWRYLKGAKKITRVHKSSGTPYIYAEGSMSMPDSIDKPSRTVLTGEGGSSPSRFKHIIKQGNRFRRLTPIELERLNGFPDDWTKLGSKIGEISPGRRSFFMGNALVVDVVARIGEVLAAELRSPNSPKV